MNIDITQPIRLDRYEPGITPKVFDQVPLAQAIRRVPIRHDFLYCGLFFCGFCHRQMVGERQKGHVYYRCHAKHHPGSCVREEAMSIAIDETFAYMEAETAAQRLRQDGPRRFRPASQQRAELEHEIQEISRQITRLADLYVDGEIEQDDYRSRRVRLATDKGELERRLLSPVDLTPADQALDLLQIYRTASAQERRELIRCLTDRREVTGKQVCITAHDGQESSSDRWGSVQLSQ